MNLSTAIFLVNSSVRSVRVEYDPESKYNNNPNKFFKTLDDGLKVDDYVIIPTHTRHGFTVCKVVEVDFRVNFDSHEQWAWIVGKVDKTMYDDILEQERKALDRIGKAEENRKRKELADALKLEEVDFGDLNITKSKLIPAPASVYGQQAAELPTEAPPPAPDTI
jgi:hypothetical protein